MQLKQKLTVISVTAFKKCIRCKNNIYHIIARMNLIVYQVFDMSGLTYLTYGLVNITISWDDTFKSS